LRRARSVRLPRITAKRARADLTRKDGHWSPPWRARELEGRVRGFDPWPGVWALVRGKRIRVDAARALDESNPEAPPGALLAIAGGELRLACADGTLAAIETVQSEGGRAMRAREAVNGRLLQPGDRLERPEPAA
jgi:methionyl-tRNA formyltransferase